MIRLPCYEHNDTYKKDIYIKNWIMVAMQFRTFHWLTEPSWYISYSNMLHQYRKRARNLNFGAIFIVVVSFSMFWGRFQ